MSEFVNVGSISDFEQDQGKAIEVNGRLVAIFRKGDQFFAIDDFCPHMGASLAGGYVEGEMVTCPWHAWRFCIRDGTWEDNPRVKVDAFEVRVEEGNVMVKVNSK
jgi:nitrite reductase (NADH) small subunit/3-phenylpropionate/trans-cinnamate dioxygenase ferredoxin subunit